MRYDRITLGVAPCAALDVHGEEALVWREKIMRILAALGVQTIDIRQTAGLDFICTRQEAARAGQSLRGAHVDGVFYPVFGRDAALAPYAAREAGYTGYAVFAVRTSRGDAGRFRFAIR